MSPGCYIESVLIANVLKCTEKKKIQIIFCCLLMDELWKAVTASVYCAAIREN